MAQSAASPTPNVLKPPIAASANAQLGNPFFYPRKEFLLDQHRVLSTFSLLTLAGQGYVRLHNFPDPVINGLRRYFDQRQLFSTCRENVTNHFFEFSLDHRPWANVKSLGAEKLILSILGVIFQYGYVFLSTIEYAKEQDDKVALAFSRPTITPISSSIPAVANGSVCTLPHGGCSLFAISFPSKKTLRVIEPPLSLTPAILQSVRNAWPRGIVDEKRIGDSHEFRLRGYGWLQENTFAADSLQQILSLLSALDRHSFTLLTSLTLGSRVRNRDLWIFAGPLGESQSPPASPVRSSLELKRELTLTPQHGMSLSESRQSNIRSVSPFASSPLKQVTPSHSGSSSGKLRKPFPKAQLPMAFRSDTSLNDVGKPPSDAGTVDMTGIGTLRKDGQPRTPDVLYTTGPPGDGYQQDFNPWDRSVGPPTNHPPSRFLSIPFARQHSRHYSMSSADDPVFRASVPDSPYDVARPPSHSSSSGNSRIRRASSPLASSPMNMFSQPLRVSPSLETPPQAPFDSPVPLHSVTEAVPGSNSIGSEAPRIPTPPLLGPGAFRDSTFSSSTGWRSTEIPITWTGKDPEPLSNVDPQLPLTQFSVTRIIPPGPAPGPPLGPRERRPSNNGPRIESEPQASQPVTQPPVRRASSGPVLPGAWNSTPKEEKRQDDVVGNGTPPLTNSSSSTPHSSSMIPPTITEQPSQEGDEVQEKMVKARVPEQQKAEGEGARKSEAAWVGNMLDRNVHPPNGTMPKMPTAASNAQAVPPATTEAPGAPSATNGSAQPKRPNAPRANSISEGWVLVNIDRAKSPTAATSIARSSAQGSTQASQSSLRAPPLKHQRSHSDSQVPTLAKTMAGAGRSTMSPAAKAIVAVDAIGVKETARQKAQSGSRIKRLLGRSGDKSESRSPEPSAAAPSPQPSPAKGRPAAQSQGQGNGTVQAKGNAKQAGTPGRAKGGSLRVKSK